jgi:hypothetical protein
MNCVSSSSQVKSESLGIPQKIQLKVDVESGKLVVKKSKDGPEDKFYSHKKSKAPRFCSAAALSGDQPQMAHQPPGTLRLSWAPPTPPRPCGTPALLPNP